MRDKIFVMFNGSDHGDGELSLWCKAPPGAQDILVGGDPARFFVPPYVGHNGWVGVRLDGLVDWGIGGSLVTDSYRMTAPKRLLAQLDAATRRLGREGGLKDGRIGHAELELGGGVIMLAAPSS